MWYWKEDNLTRRFLPKLSNPGGFEEVGRQGKEVEVGRGDMLINDKHSLMP